jgi:hypothetical protein
VRRLVAAFLFKSVRFEKESDDESSHSKVQNPMTTAKPDDVFRFACNCGAVLSARVSQVGRKAQCGKCKQILVVPEPSAQPAASLSAAAEAPMREVCSVCQHPIEADDERTACNRCGLPFHEECWKENLGCSAYGCSNVNALKTGPDIRIGQFQPTANPYHMTPQFAQPRPAPTAPEKIDLPWDHILLGASALAALMSIVTCGIPSLITGVAAIGMLAARQGQGGIALPLLSMAMAALGTLLGGCLSFMLWSS